MWSASCAIERAETGEGGYGSHCELGDAGFASWTCDAGLSCHAIGNAPDDRGVGQCFPTTLGQVGDPCELGRMRPDPDGRRDKVVGAASGACIQGVCEVNQVGFPEGMCAVRCAKGGEDVSCGAIAILSSFDVCLGQGRPFTECIERNVRPAGLRRCDDAEPFRDDYLCVRTAGGHRGVPSAVLLVPDAGGWASHAAIESVGNRPRCLSAPSAERLPTPPR